MIWNFINLKTMDLLRSGPDFSTILGDRYQNIKNPDDLDDLTKRY